MGALNPLFLLAGIAVTVPIFLHLFQRHQTRRLSFPALRYLERTEKEHARRIRLRQLLLLLARVLVLVLLVGAGARLVFLGRGASHPPTAVAIVLDNSMSAGLVVGELRVLDRLKELALETVEDATDEDRFWLIRAGEPWLPAIPGGPAEVREAIRGTEASSAAGDLSAALERAAALLSGAELGQREIHLLSDLQRTAFELPGSGPAGALPVVVWAADEDGTPPNRALSHILVGGGLPPLEGQRTDVTIGAGGAEGDTARMPVRVVVDDRIRGAASVAPGSETSVALPPAGSGWVRGYADADPDALRADDRRFFAFQSRPAPTVAVRGDPGIFVTQALEVLQEAGRVRPAPAQTADLVVSHAGTELERSGPQSAVLVTPPADPTLLPALNRRLADAGIPWRYEPRPGFGDAALEGVSLPEPLAGVRAREWYVLAPQEEPGTPTRTLAELQGSPWAVEGRDREGRPYLLLGSSLEGSATTLPVSTGMLRFVDWAASEWAGAGGVAAELTAGAHLSAPAAATHVRFPSGILHEIDGTRTVRGTGEAGFYTFLAGDSTVSVVALNPPSEESVLETLGARELADAIGPGAERVDRPEAWSRAVFRARQGPELWRSLLVLAIALLLLESAMATSGRREARGSRTPRIPVTVADAAD